MKAKKKRKPRKLTRSPSLPEALDRQGRGRHFKNAAAARAARRKVDPIEREVDRLLASMRAPLIAGIRDLVAHGVRYQLDNLLDALDKRVVAIN